MNAPAWITYAEATEITGKSRRTLKRLIDAGELTCRKHGRSVRLLRSDVLAHAPTTTCEVVRVEVAPDLAVEGLRLGGVEEVIATKLIEQTLGYADGSLADLIRGPWADEFEEGTHHRVLGSDVLAGFGALTGAESVSARAPSLHVLTEQGVALVLMKSSKEPAARLRRALVRTGFMRGVARAVMVNDPQQLTEALAPEVPAWVGEMFRRQDARMDRLEGLVLQLVETRSAPPSPQQAPTGQQRSSDYYEPIMRAEEVCKMLAARYPELRDKPLSIHTLAKRCGLVDPLNGSGDVRYTRRVVLGADRGPTRFFSPAAVDKMAIFLRGEGRLDFTGGGR